MLRGRVVGAPLARVRPVALLWWPLVAYPSDPVLPFRLQYVGVLCAVPCATVVHRVWCGMGWNLAGIRGILHQVLFPMQQLRNEHGSSAGGDMTE